MTNIALARTPRNAAMAVSDAPQITADGGLPFRTAPHNIEAEQALLGAILVNNEAHDRVSGFLLPEHFFDPVHAEIYETAAKLIGAGKQATPVTLKTFFENAEPIDSDLTVPQYLGRLAASATTIITGDRSRMLGTVKSQRSGRSGTLTNSPRAFNRAAASSG